jgi:1,4-dihydroxy-2-naphthoate octaprenyltransferase
MNRILIWTIASRPKTLIASISPILIGTTLALSNSHFDLILFLFTLATAIGIQVATNLANDYFDFIKGADTTKRKGPVRVVQAGLVNLKQMKKGLLLCLTLTLLSGSYLIWHAGIALACLLSVCLLLAVIYTGGPFPLAYLGLGEVFVFVFFGPVAVSGTYYLQTGHITLISALAGIAPGALSTAILIVNHVRDIDEDRAAHKKTCAVRFGLMAGKIEYLFAILLSFLPLIYFAPLHPFTLLILGILPSAIFLIRLMFNHTAFSQLNRLFGETGNLLWLYTLLFCIGWLM